MSDPRLQSISAARWRLATLLTAVMTAVYVGFILLVAFNKPLLATQLVPGLSVGMLLGVLVIAAAWAITVVYVRWANRHYDATVEAIRQAERRQG